MKRILILILCLIITGCYGTSPEQIEEVTSEAEPLEDGWKDVELKDVLTDTTYKISDFDKPILLESFAVWCPTCRKQQEKIKELHEDIGDAAISISIDTDPNEEEAQVIRHAENNDFDWIFTVSPIQVTQALIDDFGITVVNAPSAPVVLICPDGAAKLLGRGVKSANELKQEIERC
ncbi:MAG: redoxin family protein [Candidatus Woesearchaeota archaeon]